VLWAVLLAFVVITLLIGVKVDSIAGPIYGEVAILLCGAAFGLPGLLILLSKGFTTSEVETRSIPNQGIHESARNALACGLLSALSATIVVATPVASTFYVRDSTAYALANGLVGGLLFGSPFGLATAFAVGLKAGGLACLKHWTFRLLLVGSGSAPWNYVKFLDYAADRILLRKVGGGYMFIHRMLLEYFAARYVDPSAERPQSSLSSTIETEA
jgi:hypothetical protein